jgi:hypothetical protein
MSPENRDLRVDQLSLDPANPRLPQDLQGAEQHRLLRYLSDEAVLDEIIQSYVDNSFFQHEPLIAFEDDEFGFVVLEGNRRLAALKILLGEPDAREEGLEPLLDEPPSPELLRDLQEVPVYVVADREEVHKYLGYRHIGGIKSWSAEAKARYLMLETDRAASQGEQRPFLDVARRVGSNSQGVRNSYTAITLLRHAREEFGIQINYVLERRFGVWLRCMTSHDVRTYVGLNGARTYEEVREETARTNGPALQEVLGDLSPSNGDRPLLNDSRDVTVYGKVLHHDVAHDVLRRYRDLGVARQIVELAELPERIYDLGERIDVARDEAERTEYSDELGEAAEVLFASARSLRATIRALTDEDNE